MVHNINSRYSITFDDVLLSPNYSEIKPKDTNTSIKLSNLQLHIPIIFLHHQPSNFKFLQTP